MRKTSTITNIISPAMQRHMRVIEAPAHFLLVLRPGVTKLDFIAVANRNHAEMGSLDDYQRLMDLAFEEIQNEIKPGPDRSLPELSNTSSLFKLCHDVVTRAKTLEPRLEFSDQHVRAVAVRWLEQETLSLGKMLDSGEGVSARWRVEPNHQPFLRFQDAIDWYAKHDCSLPDARHDNPNRYVKDYGECGSGPYKTILIVPNSANRPNIVNHSNLKVFLAEHLLAYDQYVLHLGTTHADEPDGEPGLTFFLLPIKGLGQYRAAIDWVGIDGYKTNSEKIDGALSKQASKLQRLGLESLFTQSLIRSFSTSSRQAFSEAKEGSKSSDGLYQAFADLWWANEVRFHKAGQLQKRLVRAEGEDDTTWAAPTNEPLSWSPGWSNYGGSFKGFLATAGNGHPELTYIKLDLSSFTNPANNTDNKIAQLLESSQLVYRDLEKTVEALPFDQVVFACYFFQPVEEDLAEWVDQLADSVVSILIEQTIQRTKIVRSRAKTLERAAHSLNGIMRSVGRVAAMDNLKLAMDRLEAGHQSLESLSRVSDSLQLMVLVEAYLGLLRLYGTIDAGDYAHLQKWFDESSRAVWKMPTAFAEYCKSISHLVHTIGNARGHKVIRVLAAGKEIENGGNCALDLDDVRFPPLSKAEKMNEPILALIPAITEPFDNSLKHCEKKGRLGRETPIRVEIEDRRQSEAPSILVNIGNPFEGGDLPSTRGLVRAQELMEFTELATIGTGELKDVDGETYYFVPVHLHPQRLAERIDKLTEPDDSGWLCY